MVHAWRIDHEFPYTDVFFMVADAEGRFEQTVHAGTGESVLLEDVQAGGYITSAGRLGWTWHSMDTVAGVQPGDELWFVDAGQGSPDYVGRVFVEDHADPDVLQHFRVPCTQHAFGGFEVVAGCLDKNGQFPFSALQRHRTGEPLGLWTATALQMPKSGELDLGKLTWKRNWGTARVTYTNTSATEEIVDMRLRSVRQGYPYEWTDQAGPLTPGSSLSTDLPVDATFHDRIVALPLRVLVTKDGDGLSSGAVVVATNLPNDGDTVQLTATSDDAVDWLPARAMDPFSPGLDIDWDSIDCRGEAFDMAHWYMLVPGKEWEMWGPTDSDMTPPELDPDLVEEFWPPKLSTASLSVSVRYRGESITNGDFDTLRTHPFRAIMDGLPHGAGLEGYCTSKAHFILSLVP